MLHLAKFCQNYHPIGAKMMANLFRCGISVIVAAVIALEGCSSANPLPSTSIPATATSVWTPTRILTNTPTNKPTNTPTSTPTNLPTSTQVPTLSPNTAYSRVNEFLTNGGTCQLPCWFGIVPERSTLLDIQTQLTELSSISTDSSYGFPTGNWMVSSLTIPYINNNMVIEIDSSYLARFHEKDVFANGFSAQTYRLKNGKYDGDVSNTIIRYVSIY